MSKSKQFCSVYGCKSTYKKDENISLHSFPRLGSGKVNVVNKYGTNELVNVQVSLEILFENGKTYNSKHESLFQAFCSRCFFLPWFAFKEESPEKNAVPSKNLPTVKERGSMGQGQTRALLGQNRLERKERIEQRKSATVEATITSADQDAADALMQLYSVETPLGEAPMQLEVTEHVPIPEHIPLASGSADMGIQVTSGNIGVPFVTVIDTMKKLNTLTGLPSFELLNVLCGEVEKVYIDRRIHRLTIRERVILTLFKLKQNFSFSVLSILFGTITVQTCKTVFVRTLTCLSRILKLAIPWPSKHEVMQKMPKCFDKFKATRIVLDCTEISIQKPKCLKCRLILYSHYKSGLTLKFMTGVTPAGLICHISPAYGGKASDKAMFVQSGLVDKVEHGD